MTIALSRLLFYCWISALILWWVWGVGKHPGRKYVQYNSKSSISYGSKYQTSLVCNFTQFMEQNYEKPYYMPKLPSHALLLKEFVPNWQSLVATLSVLQTIGQDCNHNAMGHGYFCRLGLHVIAFAPLQISRIVLHTMRLHTGGIYILQSYEKTHWKDMQYFVTNQNSCPSLAMCTIMQRWILSCLPYAIHTLWC